MNGSVPDPVPSGAAPDADAAIAAIGDILAEIGEQEGRNRLRLARVHPSWLPSARNLLHYLALRHRDLRPLQRQLAALGLSSLGRSESHVLATIDGVAAALDRIAGRPLRRSSAGAIGYDDGQRLLREHARLLLGAERLDRPVRVMVTMPSEAADDRALVQDLVASGMDCARINCAHDDAPTWERMVDHIRRASAATGRECRVLMDLGGPKIRTGAIDPHGQFVKWRPMRDRTGRVAAPAELWLGAPGALAPSSAAGRFEISDEMAGLLHRGDALLFTDARGKRRRLVVEHPGDGGWWATADQTAYLPACSEIELEWRSSPEAAARRCRAKVGEPGDAAHLLLRRGDLLVITGDGVPGRPEKLDRDGRCIEPARISCTLPEAIAAARPGDPVWLDDGKIGGVVEAAIAGMLGVRITQARESGSKLRADKGINLPESPLHVPALTDKDRRDLDFVARHADMVGLSFVNRAGDIASLREELRRRSAERIGIVLKIETRRAFRRLPELLFAAMGATSIGVMIARGDLAVECGYERLAEAQEEILWLCEAAHVPVIWATQVLESLAKTGQPSRAEVTDAAMGERAECVMLNKGPHLAKAVRTLDDILRRMHAHQQKKSAMLRRLEIAALLDEASDAG